MKNKHTIDLHPSEDQLEDYEVENKNLVYIEVGVKKDRAPARGEGYRVIMTLSASAMIGFGTELIRKGLAAQANQEVLGMDDEPITPITKDYLFNSGFGFYLAPGSADLMIFLDDLGTIDEAKAQLKE